MSDLQDDDLDHFPLNRGGIGDQHAVGRAPSDLTEAHFSRGLGRTRRFSQGKRGRIIRKYPQPVPSAQGNTGARDRKKVIVIRRRYRIIRQLGGGGYGKVYLAHDLRLDIDVAIKELLQMTNDPSQNQKALEDFAREAKMLAGLSQEHLPGVFDFFSLAQRSYLVMEYIEGETLESYVARVGAVVDPKSLDQDFPARGRALPVQEVLAIGIQMCEVLEYLHAHEPPVIFRDVKPTNVMRQAKSGKLFLIDFGIARHFKPGQRRDTVALGSPGYAPPEQYGKSQTTAQSDIYGLGALLHHLVTGDDPSGSASPFYFASLLQRVQNSHVDVGDFERLLLQMVDTDIQKRPGSANEVKMRLLLLQSPPVVPATPSNSPKKAFRIHTHSSPVLAELVRVHVPTPVACIAWSPDSSRIATGGADGSVRIWNRAGNELVSFSDAAVAPSRICWSPDARFLAVVRQCDTGVHIWRADTGLWEAHFANPQGAVVRSVVWSPDGMLFALGDRRSVVVWDTASKRRLTTISHPEESVGVSLLCWSPDSAFLAFNGRIRYPLLFGERKEAISIWRATVQHKVLDQKSGPVRVSDRRYKALFEQFSGNVVRMSWSTDSVHLASVYEQTKSSWERTRFWRTFTVSIWNKNTGKSIVAEKQLADLPQLMWWQGEILCLIDDNGWLRQYDRAGRAISSQPLIPKHPRVVACAPDRMVLARATQDNPQLLLLEVLPYF